MSYRLATTTTASSSTTTTMTSHLSQCGASGSDTDEKKSCRYTLNPEARTFIPGARQHSNSPSNITDRQATANPSFTPRTFQPGKKKPVPEAVKKKIDSAFATFNNQNFPDAEKAFRVILHENKNRLSPFDKQNITVGLARSLKEQTREKQLEACSLLEELRLEGELTRFGASTIYNLDLTLSLCEEALGKHFDAETRLLKLRKKRRNADEETLCRPSHYYPADITNARLWQSMGKHTLAETLLLNLKKELDQRLQPKPYASAAPKLQKYLDNVNLALVRHWDAKKKYELAEKLLLEMSRKHPNNSEKVLCEPCGHHDIDLTLARLWQTIGKYKRTEKLLLNMSGKRPGASEEELCQPSWQHETDLALIRYWELTGKYKLAEKLLLSLCGKHPDASEEILCKPCWQHNLDLALARLWEAEGKYHLSERLLLNMIGKHSNDREEILSVSSGHHDIDLTLALLWQAMHKPELTERLLLNMSGKSLNDSEESLCKPAGHHDIDLALIFFWKTTGKHERFQTLLRRCCELYHSDECQLTLLSMSAGKAGFLEMISRYPENANTLLVTSIHYFTLACEHITNDDLKSGNDHLVKALEIVDSVLEKYPFIAGAYSQKGHCLRMLGRSEQEWKEWFIRALSLDPGREYRCKTDFWRSNEATALQKVLASQVK
ncbi:hypothetical protein [Endozoicomonas sp. 8E]|uniref:hypothetical protein n=1 Tax=Endozoicomonas sp. 8E TaxID=3035692 RepID=UPI002938F76B|nr:hypothetical protein [Endozoicomonas sp. 8E]WOG26241.1 hypothetical protein P6910_16945 [Endozoicomonas sp. 8E]